MAEAMVRAVIYIIIANQMTTTANSSASNASRMSMIRWFMTIVGVTIAIACAIVLSRDLKPAEVVEDGSTSMRISIRPVEQLSSVQNLVVLSKQIFR
jgi:hypothetical protein